MAQFGQVLLEIVLVVQMSSAYQLAVPVFKQPYGGGDSTYIVGGETAIKGQFPHQAAIIIESHNFCGGSLISETWVLTAAHCVNGHKKWTVVLGAQNIKDTNEPGRVTVASQKAIFHEKFQPVYYYNDIGVISLPTKIKISDQIKIITLSPPSFQNENFVGKTVRASGWGKTSDSSTSFSPTLQFVDLSIISQKDCQKVYGNDVITNKVYCCSGTEKKSTFNGDSGGALTIGRGKNLTQLGIVSFGASAGCAEGYPSVFTAIPFYADWVSAKTGIPIRDY